MLLMVGMGLVGFFVRQVGRFCCGRDLFFSNEIRDACIFRIRDSSIFAHLTIQPISDRPIFVVL